MNKKTIMMIAIVIVILLVIGGIVWFLNANHQIQEEGVEYAVEESKTMKIYQKLKESEAYQFARKIDNDNKILIAKKGDRGYEEETFKGNQSKYVVKDGDLYLLREEDKKYYKYQNNDTMLYVITDAFSKIEGMNYTNGKEEINQKEYKYEEFKGIQEFVIDSNLNTDNLESVKTRFYYSGNDLKYIKTIVGDKEELLEIEIKYQAEDSLFEIPEGYQDGMNS